MILNVNQIFANANQEKIREKMLYWIDVFALVLAPTLTVARAYHCLNVEEEHPNDAVTRFVQLEEVGKRILRNNDQRRSSSQVQGGTYDRRRKRTVQPATTLRNKLGNRGWHVSRSFGALHVLQSK